MVTRVTPTKSTRYEHDCRNLRVMADDGTSLIQYEYDGLGDRVAQIKSEIVSGVQRLAGQPNGGQVAQPCRDCRCAPQVKRCVMAQAIRRFRL